MEQFAQQFVTTFYQAFDQNKANIINFYQQPSTLTFFTWTAQGPQAIAERLKATSFQKVQHQIKDMSCQIIQGSPMIMINVIGQIKIDDDNAMIFTENFVLCQMNNNWFILNDIMQLVQIQN